MIASTPTFFEYDPTQISWQHRFIDDVFNNFLYDLGTHEVLCSGSVGSGKSLPAAHIIVRCCLQYNRNRICIGRKSLPDLKDTLFKKIVEHLEDPQGRLKEGVDYWINETSARIRFANGSEIISRSWSDRKFKKLGSIEVSGVVIEEASENDQEDLKAYEYLKMRAGRLPHIPMAFVISLTNPDSPTHWLYKKFFVEKGNTRHVYLSNLKDNPFLPRSYEEGLRKDMDPKLARRMLDGEWIEIEAETVYHQYSRDLNYRDYSYQPNPLYSVHISWDFNIGKGKPLSCVMAQWDGKAWHIFNEVVVEGMRTEQSCEELAEAGLLSSEFHYILNGDATGKHSDTRNTMSDWDIIESFFNRYYTEQGHLNFELQVALSNPKVRHRHNRVNAYCCNAIGQRRLYVYKDAPTADEGMRLTELKKRGQYIEDDSKPYQHITTAIGYMICETESQAEASNTHSSVVKYR